MSDGVLTEPEELVEELGSDLACPEFGQSETMVSDSPARGS